MAKTAGSVTGEISASTCTVEYKWVIDYDSVCWKEVGDVIRSPVFTTDKISSTCHWQIALYPNGILTDSVGYFSVYLNLRSNDDFKVELSFRLLNDKNKELIKRSYGVLIFNACSNSYGLPKFLKRDRVDKDAVTSCSDKLILACEITVRESKGQKEIDLFSHHQRLIADYEQLIRNKEFSDVEFLIGNKQIHAHKSILSQRSPVFAAMFRNAMREKHENKVQITDIRLGVFQEMLRYIYAGKVNGIESMAGELLAAADKYALDSLKLMCAKSLCDSVNADNAFENLRLADRHSVESLKIKTIEFIVTEATDIVNKPEFRQLPCNIVCDVCTALANKKK